MLDQLVFSKKGILAIVVFSRVHATLHLAVSVGRSVRQFVRHIFEFRAVFALLLPPNCPQLSCRVSGLVSFELTKNPIEMRDLSGIRLNFVCMKTNERDRCKDV